MCAQTEFIREAGEKIVHTRNIEAQTEKYVHDFDLFNYKSAE